MGRGGTAMESGSALSEEFGLCAGASGSAERSSVASGIGASVGRGVEFDGAGFDVRLPVAERHLPLWRYAPPVVDSAGIAAQPPVGTDLVPSAGDGVSGGGAPGAAGICDSATGAAWRWHCHRRAGWEDPAGGLGRRGAVEGAMRVQSGGIGGAGSGDYWRSPGGAPGQRRRGWRPWRPVVPVWRC